MDHQDGRKLRQIFGLSLELLQTTGCCAWGRQGGNGDAILPSIMQRQILDKGIALDILQLEPSGAFDTGSYKILPSLRDCLACFE